MAKVAPENKDKATTTKANAYSDKSKKQKPQENRPLQPRRKYNFLKETAAGNEKSVLCNKDEGRGEREKFRRHGRERERKMTCMHARTAYTRVGYLRDHPVPTASDLSPALSPRLCA